MNTNLIHLLYELSDRFTKLHPSEQGDFMLRYEIGWPGVCHLLTEEGCVVLY